MFIEEDDDRKQQFRYQVVREQPFRSTSNDVSQVTDRCNVDYQFLACVPPLPPEAEDGDAYQLAGTSALVLNDRVGKTHGLLMRPCLRKDAARDRYGLSRMYVCTFFGSLFVPRVRQCSFKIKMLYMDIDKE